MFLELSAEKSNSTIKLLWLKKADTGAEHRQKRSKNHKNRSVTFPNSPEIPVKFPLFLFAVFVRYAAKA